MTPTANILLKAIALILLIVIASFFTSSETAYLSLTNIKVRQMIRNRQKGARKVAALKGNMDNLLTVVLIGINFVNTLAASIATTIAVSILGQTGVGVATILMTFFLTIFSSIIPKTIAAENPAEIAAKNAPVLYLLQTILYPLVWFFSNISKGIVFVLSKLWKKNDAVITEEELKVLIDVGENEGTIEASEKNMLNRIIKITDLHVRNMMKHRSLLTTIPSTASRNDAIELFKKTGFSRLLVYKDTQESIVGILDYKHVLFNQNDQKNYAQENMTEPLFVPETFTVIEIIQTFKEEGKSFAVALDEQGCTAGIISRDDVLRSVFGRMTEEYENTGIAPELRVKVVSPNNFIFPGDMKLSDVNSILNLNLESNEYNTLGGWLLEHFDALPSTGEALKFNNILFIVNDQAQRKIQSVQIKLDTSKPLQDCK